MLILGQYGVVFACVFKDTNMTCTCFGPDKMLEPAYSTQEPSYSLLSSHISQVVTCLPQREQNYSFLYTLSIKTQHPPEAKHSQHPPDESQLTPSILQRNQTQPAFSRREPNTPSIFQTRTKPSQKANIQPASSKREPNTASILQIARRQVTA